MWVFLMLAKRSPTVRVLLNLEESPVVSVSMTKKRASLASLVISDWLLVCICLERWFCLYWLLFSFDSHGHYSVKYRNSPFYIYIGFS